MEECALRLADVRASIFSPSTRDLSVKSGFDQTCSRGTYNFDAEEGRFRSSCAPGPDAPFEDYVASTLDVSDCLANSNGQLVGRDRGRALASCQDCNVDTTVLQCDCQDENNDLVTSTIDLNTVSADSISSRQYHPPDAMFYVCRSLGIAKASCSATVPLPMSSTTSPKARAICRG